MITLLMTAYVACSPDVADLWDPLILATSSGYTKINEVYFVKAIFIASYILVAQHCFPWVWKNSGSLAYSHMIL